MSDPITRLNAALEGRYSVERELGEGGMATVYLAQDLKHERRVALKVMKPDLAAAIGAERFLSEIKTTANLQHPHILPLHDSGNAGGALFYVMPYVQGETLREKLKRDRQLPVDVALRIATAVGSALDYAHRNGVVHRDIKPSNILLQDGEPIVGDFGIALVAAAGDESRLTRSGMSMGTSQYMSPEQATGEGLIGPSSDIYSLACVLYEMLSGDPPHTGSPQAVLAKMLTQKPLAVREVRDTVPASVDAAITKALARVSADRFVTANHFVKALSGAATGLDDGRTPTAAEVGERDSTEWTLAVAGLRRRWWVAVTAVVVLAGVGQQLYRGRATPLDDRTVVVGIIENQTGDATLDQLAALAASSITEGLARTGVVDVIPPATATQTGRVISGEIEAGAVLDPVATLAARTGAGLVVSGSFFRQASDLVFHLQLMDAARDTLLLALEPVRGSSETPDEVIDAVRQRLMGALSILFDERIVLQAGAAMYPPTYDAYQEFSSGLTAFQRSECGTALPHFTRASELDSSFVAPLLYAAYCLVENQGFTEQERGPSADSVLRLVSGRGKRLTPYESESLAFHRAIFDADREGAYRAIARAAALAPGSFAEYKLAEVAMILGRPAETVRVLEGLDPERGPMGGFFPYWLQMTWALHILRDHEAELEAAREARRLFPDDMIPLQMEVSALAALHRVNEIEDVIDDSEVMLRRAEALGPGQSQADIWRRAGEELRGHGHQTESVELFNRAIRWYEGMTPEELRDVWQGRYWYGICLYHVDRAREAIAVFEELSLENPAEIWHHGNMGVAAAIAGDTARADAELTWLRGYESAEFEGGLKEWNLARVTARLGRAEDAVSLLNEAVRKGHMGGRWWVHMAIDFAPLVGYAPFDEFARPKG